MINSAVLVLVLIMVKYTLHKMYHLNHFFSVQFSGIKFIQVFVQPSPSSSSPECFSFCITEPLNPLNMNSPSPSFHPPATTTLLSVSVTFDHLRYLPSFLLRLKDSGLQIFLTTNSHQVNKLAHTPPMYLSSLIYKLIHLYHSTNALDVFFGGVVFFNFLVDLYWSIITSQYC